MLVTRTHHPAFLDDATRFRATGWPEIFEKLDDGYFVVALEYIQEEGEDSQYPMEDVLDEFREPGPWPWILTIVKVWQNGGYFSVIFLAAITSIPEEVYEAGAIDGASRARMAWSITVPLLAPTLSILLILGVGRIFFGDFGTIFAIIGDNGTLFSTTDVIDTFVFRSLRTVGDFGTTAAAGLFQSVVGFFLVTGAVLVQRRLSPESSVI